MGQEYNRGFLSLPLISTSKFLTSLCGVRELFFKENGEKDRGVHRYIPASSARMTHITQINTYNITLTLLPPYLYL